MSVYAQLAFSCLCSTSSLSMEDATHIGCLCVVGRLSISVTIIKTTLHRCAEKLASWVTPNPVK